jgi:hypothetical protein
LTLENQGNLEKENKIEDLSSDPRISIKQIS